MSIQADRLEIEDVPICPGKPAGTWQRLRVRDQVKTLWERGVIDAATWLAVCQFRRDSDVAAGLREETGVRVEVSRTPQPFTDDMLDASRRVAGAWRAIEPEGLLVRFCVMAEGTLRAFEADQRIRNGSATPRLHAALDRLCRYYNGLT